MEAIWLAELLKGKLDRQRPEPLQRQLYFLIRAAILSGTIAPKRKLPSTRQLAQELALGRNTVAAAFEQLAAEGYLVSRIGAGSFVADSVPRLNVHVALNTVSATPRLSARAQLLLATPTMAGFPSGAFVPGLPELEQFPHADWQRLLNRHWREPRASALGYGAGAGLPALKSAIAEYLHLARAVRCRPEQVVITAGAQQGLDLALRLLTDPGEAVVLEDPGYLGARQVMQANGVRVLPVPVDNEGLRVDAIPWQEKPRLVYATPSHQYPSGAVMSLTRRRALLALAAQHDAYVLEDDYDSEFRYTSAPLASLQGLDDTGRVLYVGTFSKILFPALRIGYLVVPEALLEAASRLLARIYREGQQTTQAALADFIREGRLAAHIRRMRQLYAERQAVLRETWMDVIGAAIPLSGGEAGMHLTARLPARLDDQRLAAAAHRRGLTVRPLSVYGLEAREQGLVLGYAGVPEAELRRATRVLADLLGDF